MTVLQFCFLLDILASHFPNIQEIISFLYKMRNIQKKVEKIDDAIYNSNIRILSEIENQ